MGEKASSTGSVGGRVRRSAGKAARRIGVYDAIKGRRTAASPALLGGVVEEFTNRHISGWVAVPEGSPIPRVTLLFNNIEVVSAWAADPAERKATGQAHAFRFRVNDVWKFARKGTKVTVRCGGQALPIVGHGMHANPTWNGKRELTELRDMLASGYIFSSEGKLQLSKKLDKEWQGQVLGLYDDVRAVLKDSFGYDSFVMYGSLLGAVREKGFIGHDFDLDMAYVSAHREGPQAADEMKRLAFTFIERGFDVDAKRTALHIHHPDDHATRIDLFHLYFDEDGVLSFPFGVAGDTDVRIEDWKGVTRAPFEDREVDIPVNARTVVEAVYGASWEKPKPGFDWNRDRTRRATEGTIEVAAGQEVYWANFYSRTEYTEGSTFHAYVSERDDTPRTVIDIGCGDGRDSYAFASAGRRVWGLDRSHVGVANATAKAESMGLTDHASFRACDVSDHDGLQAVLNEAMAASPDEPVMFYLRFFLHSIPEEVQDALMATIAATARSGDMFAAEFRSTADEQLDKVHGNHYRRFQDGWEFGRALSERYGFEVLFELEDSGLSPYKDEDPVLYRVVGRHR